MAEGFRAQLTFGAPTNADEAALRRLSRQLRTGRLVVRLFLRHSLHAKLYLHHQQDPNLPIVAFVGSSNLTMAGLSRQGELNVDVLDHDACTKLQAWFERQWNDRFCVDVTSELADIIDESWARAEPLSPYEVYLKMALHLSREAQAGISEFTIPAEFRGKLFPFQEKAVQIAAHHLHKRGGVLIGDVVGLGKTMMASAVAKVFEEDHDTETLVICPKNLVHMWEDYLQRFRLYGRVISQSNVERGKRYAIISDYIDKNDSRVILVSATPYNKQFRDLGSQLALFVDREGRNLGIKPEAALREVGEVEFVRRHQ
jgi:hypothetical protein